MSQPKLSGEQLQVAVDAQNVLRITNDPGFTSDNGDNCPYRAVNLQGPTPYGQHVAPKTRPDQRWPGYFHTRQELANWHPTLSPGAYSLVVFAGTLFEPWVPGQEGPFIEWGADDKGQNPTGIPRVNQVTFTVGQPQPDAIQLLRQGVAQLENSTAYKSKFTNVVAGTKKCRQALDALT